MQRVLSIFNDFTGFQIFLSSVKAVNHKSLDLPTVKDQNYTLHVHSIQFHFHFVHFCTTFAEFLTSNLENFLASSLAANAAKSAESLIFVLSISVAGRMMINI